MSSTLPNTRQDQQLNRVEQTDGARAASQFVIANGLQNVGDSITAAKTVLPWLLSAGGAPAFVTAMLVPIRESGSMLPQQFLTPWVKRHTHRGRLWVLGSVVQGLCAVSIGLCFFFLHGFALGLGVLVGLAVLSLGRSLCSITSKDVQAGIVEKGMRGKITGRAARLGGIASLVVGGVLTVVDSHDVLIWLIVFPGLCWFAAGWVFAGIAEPTAPVAVASAVASKPTSTPLPTPSPTPSPTGPSDCAQEGRATTHGATGDVGKRNDAHAASTAAGHEPHGKGARTPGRTHDEAGCADGV